MRDRHHRSSLREAAQRLRDPPLRGRIHRTRGLVQDQQTRGGDLRARQRHELAFTHAERLAAFAGHGVHALGQRIRPPAEPELLQGRRHVTVRGPFAAEADVLAHGAVEQEAVLRDHPHGLAARGRRHIAQVHTAQGDPPLHGVGQSRQ